MFTLTDLLCMKARYEKEKLFAEAKISVVNEMIEMEQTQPCNACEEKVEKAEEPYEAINNVVVDESY